MGIRKASARLLGMIAAGLGHYTWDWSRKRSKKLDIEGEIAPLVGKHLQQITQEPSLRKRQITNELARVEKAHSRRVRRLQRGYSLTEKEAEAESRYPDIIKRLRAEEAAL